MSNTESRTPPKTQHRKQKRWATRSHGPHQKHNTENKRDEQHGVTDPTKNRGVLAKSKQHGVTDPTKNQGVLAKSKQFLLHIRHRHVSHMSRCVGHHFVLVIAINYIIKSLILWHQSKRFWYITLHYGYFVWSRRRGHMLSLIVF
jgi:hypothetical protein